MSDEPLLSIAVVCEADADRRISCDLADRVFCHEVEWIGPEVLNSYRAYRGLETTAPLLLWHQVHDLAKERGIKAHGWFQGRPGEPDAFVARRALLLLLRSPSPPAVVLLIRDSDGYLQRRDGLQQARSVQSWRFQVVIGLAHTKRECWVLNGFEPQNPEEKPGSSNSARRLGSIPASMPTGSAHGLPVQSTMQSGCSSNSPAGPRVVRRIAGNTRVWNR